MKNKIFQLNPEPQLEGSYKFKKDEKIVNLSNFLVALQDFLFVLFISPFRVIETDNPESSTRVFIIKAYWPQKIICGIFSLLSAFSIVSMVIAFLPGASKKPPDHLNFLNVLLYAFVAVIVMKRWWLDSDLFAKLANFLNSERRLLPQCRNTCLVSKAFVILFCLLFVGASFIELWSDFDKSGDNSTEPKIWWEEMTVRGKKLFFIPKGAMVGSEMEVILGVLGIINCVHL